MCPTSKKEGHLGETSVHRGQARSDCVFKPQNLRARCWEQEQGLDSWDASSRMEVASALLEASKKLSGSSDSSTNSSCSATATWTSMSEVGLFDNSC